MLKRDFIMVQIEELGKVIAQLISNRNTNNGAARASETLKQVFTSLDTDPETLLTETPEKTFARMDEGGRSAVMRMEIAAKALIETSYERPGDRAALLGKAKELLLYVQAHDNTFSLDRMETIGTIDRLLP